VDVSCALAPSAAIASEVALAESLGYRRAWLYDSPAVYPDVWLSLGQCAERTTRIGLGPAVLVPSLRHPMANAAAIAGLAEQAPGRVAAAIGAGFSGRMALGERAMRWTDVAQYIRVLRALLNGDDAVWNGVPLRMLHPPGFGAARPVAVPILVGADGPKGCAVADELGDGIFSVVIPQAGAPALASWRALLTFGTVLGEGEELTSPRVLGALAPAAAVIYHATYDRDRAAVDALPGGQQWRESLEAVPEATRHLALHAGHLVRVTDGDSPFVAGLMPLAASMSLTGTPDQIREKISGLAAAGVTEIAYQPTGHDIGRELRSFASAARLREEDQA
jgi:5,10-methylenetetrahydromethanopterin reductase